MPDGGIKSKEFGTLSKEAQALLFLGLSAELFF
jgi:hypothetical protein